MDDMINSKSKFESSLPKITEIAHENVGSSLDMELSPNPKTDPEKGLATVMISHHLQPLVYFEDGDSGNPRNWSPKKKSAIGFFALFSAFVATLGTPIYIASIPSITEDFKISTTLAISPTSLYAYGLGIGSLFATAFAEIFGRRIVYQVTVPLSLVFTIIGGTAKTFATLAVARTLAGILSGPCLTVGVGVLNDLWDLSLDKTGTTFAVLYAMFIIYGTQIGPMASGSLITHHSWRWTFWVSAILIGVTAVAAFLIPETYAPKILRSRAKKENITVKTRGESLSLFLVSVGRPLHMIIVEPLILPSGLVLAVTQSIIFAYYVGYALLFEKVYNFSQFHVGMAFVPLLVGSLLAVPVVAAFDRLTYQKARAHAIASGTTVHPETRLYPAMLGVILLPISLFWLAWTGRLEVHWILPVLSGVLFGLAYVLNMLCLPIYNNDVYATHYGASVMAATTFMRFAISSSFPLFTVQMINNLGFAWATSLLGFITVAMIPVPWVFFKWGPALRSRSRYLRAEQ
ncbi:hypothetical protein EG329_002094 [Mollisiaceae sp. DMI_Dod_QoI]|nr:hypothetical protein EG329_002094 [Helotiales sp. DMI_Dod_QoI]